LPTSTARSSAAVVVYTGPEDALREVRAVFPEPSSAIWSPPEPAALAQALSDAHALIDASMKVRITAPMIAASPGLRVVSTATTGADHIDVAALASRGIPLLTLAGQKEVLAGLTPAAEHSWLLVMACARQLRRAIDHVLAGGWNRVEFPGLMLRGKTLGIVGCGRIGTWMARYARAFEMSVLAFDPHLDRFPEWVTPAALDDVLRQSDIVSVHVPLGDETRGLLSRERLLLMKPGSILVNTSRGEVVDEAALLEVLSAGRIGAAGLDVLAGEPEIQEHPLRRYAEMNSNLIITPHIGGFSPDAVRIVVRHAAGRARQVLADP